MRWAVLVVLVVAIVVVLFYALRANAETPPAPEVRTTPTPAPTPMGIAPRPLAVPQVTLQRTAEEEWRARVMLAAQDYERAAATYSERFPTSEPGRLTLYAARAIAAAAPTESRASLMFRLGFARKPPVGAGAATRAWDALAAAIRAPIEFRPELAPVPVVLGVVPLGDFST